MNLWHTGTRINEKIHLTLINIINRLKCIYKSDFYEYCKNFDNFESGKLTTSESLFSAKWTHDAISNHGSFGRHCSYISMITMRNIILRS